MNVQGQYMLMHQDGSLALVDVTFDGREVTTTTRVTSPPLPPERVIPDNTCGETTVFWPDDEACDAVCIKVKDHKGAHEDEILGEWGEE